MSRGCRKPDLWKSGSVVAGVLLLLLLMMWVPLSATSAQEETSGLATSSAVTVQATPTEDATVTALNKEKLAQEVQQLQSQMQNQNNWFFSNSGALIAAFTAIAVAVFGIIQWTGTARQTKETDRNERVEERQKEVVAQKKELRDRAEERFKTAVTALGDEKEGVQVGGAILLRSFLNGDDQSYERYYTSVFDLTVAYLCLPRIAHQSEDPDTPLPLTVFSRALIVLFKEAFPLARNQSKGDPQSLDATSINLDNGYLSEADLKQVRMPRALLRKADLSGADLRGAFLRGADLSGAILESANLSGRIDLMEANLSATVLSEADLSGALLRAANLSGASLLSANLSGAILWNTNLRSAALLKTDLRKADLKEADLRGVHFLESALLLDTNLRGVKGLAKEQLEICKAKGAIIDEDLTTSGSRRN